MNRRNFLATIASSVGGLFFGGRRAAARSVPLCTCPVTGFQYYKGPEILPRLRTGRRLVLKREPGNPYDPLAIEVYTEAGEKLGYVPRRLNEIPAGLMDQGNRLTADIMAVDYEAGPWEAVEMAIRMVRR